MKNVHLLPTDKPSRLYNNNGQLHLDSVSTTSNGHTINQNIYITNDEEIKFDDYYLGEDNNLYCLVSKVNSNGKKIILTTDQELIDEGIQPIDDEFLEWFVKNPSCEKVYTTDEYVQVNQDNPILRGSTNVSHRYEIIIPQEEHKQETLEEAALRLYPKFISDPYNPTEDLMEEERKIFIAGAKWQQEKMYSEEEVFEIAKQYAKRCQAPIQSSGWLKEQFKKK
jgi:hypothetical protein